MGGRGGGEGGSLGGGRRAGESGEGLVGWESDGSAMHFLNRGQRGSPFDVTCSCSTQHRHKWAWTLTGSTSWPHFTPSSPSTTVSAHLINSSSNALPSSALSCRLSSSLNARSGGGSSRIALYISSVRSPPSAMDSLSTRASCADGMVLPLGEARMAWMDVQSAGEREGREMRASSGETAGVGISAEGMAPPLVVAVADLPVSEERYLAVVAAEPRSALIPTDLSGASTSTRCTMLRPPFSFSLSASLA